MQVFNIYLISMITSVLPARCCVLRFVGCAPYAGMVVSELLTKLKAGHRLDKPRYCTDWL